MINKEFLIAIENNNYLTMVSEHYSNIFRKMDRSQLIIEQLKPSQKLELKDLQKLSNTNKIGKVCYVEPKKTCIIDGKIIKDPEKVNLVLCSYSTDILSKEFSDLDNELLTFDEEIKENYKKFINEANKQFIDILDIAVSCNKTTYEYNIDKGVPHDIKDIMSQIEKETECMVTEVLIHPTTLNKIITPSNTDAIFLDNLGHYDHSALYARSLIKNIDVPEDKFYLCSSHFGLENIVLKDAQAAFRKEPTSIHNMERRISGYFISDVDLFRSVNIVP